MLIVNVLLVHVHECDVALEYHSAEPKLLYARSSDMKWDMTASFEDIASLQTTCRHKESTAQGLKGDECPFEYINKTRCFIMIQNTREIRWTERKKKRMIHTAETNTSLHTWGLKLEGLPMSELHTSHDATRPSQRSRVHALGLCSASQGLNVFTHTYEVTWSVGTISHQSLYIYPLIDSSISPWHHWAFFPMPSAVSQSSYSVLNPSIIGKYNLGGSVYILSLS